MQQPFSFYVVFNPLLNGDNQNYKTQAHEFFHRLRQNLSSGDMAKSHLYWGKLRMSSHEETLDFDSYKRALEANRANGLHTHLFISDFHHFWVARVESVHQEVFDKENTLPFYDGRDVEIWFKISDMDLVSSEYVETGYYLEQLFSRNDFSKQEIESINPYLSGLRYPLIVQDRLCEQYFVSSQAHQVPRALSHNPLIEHPQESGRVANNVQTYVLPPAIYGKLSERVKKKLISIEMEIYKKDKKRDGLNKEIVESYLEILEEALNQTFVSFARQESNGKAFGDVIGNVPLPDILAVLENPTLIQGCNLDFVFSSKLGFLRYCRQELMEAVRDKRLLELRDCEPDQREAMLMRNIILGVGCKGILNSLVCLFHEDEFMDSYFRKVA